MEVFGKEIWGLGDACKVVRHCRLRSQSRNNEPIGVHCFTDLQAEIFRDVLELMDSAGTVVLTDEPVNTEFDVNTQTSPILPMKYRWTGCLESRRIAYQFDGLSQSARKNPPQEDQDWFLSLMAAQGFTMVRLGKHLGLKGSIQELINCRLFVGACSGIAQVAYSVGIPSFILKYYQYGGLLKVWHQDRALAFPADLRHFVSTLFVDGTPTPDTYTRHYTVSGITMGAQPGSTPSYTDGYRKFLEKFMDEHQIQTVLDYGCGDWTFSKLINWADRTYYGFEEVPALVDRLKRDFGTRRRIFERVSFDNFKLPPKVDLVIVKDVAQHSPNPEILYLIEKFRPAKYVMWVNDLPDGDGNWDIERGGHHKLDMTRTPFSLKGEIVYQFKENGEVDPHCKEDNKVVFLQTND